MEFAYEIAEDIKTKTLTARAVIEASLAKAHDVQARLNAFISIADEAALKAADALDARMAKGENVGALAGVPVVVKDNICTEGILTTAASKSLELFVPPYSATVIKRLEAAGAIVIAKANLDEFGMGSSNENSAFGAAKNPWDDSRVPGGSSGGSAIAVAAGVVPVALGTDTGGSVRQPASFTGVLGFKPTYGRLSRYGVIAYASSLDQVGLLARSAKDIALFMDVMAGNDPLDSTSIEQDEPAFMQALSTKQDLRGLKIGVVSELSQEGNSEGILAALGKTKDLLKDLGADVTDVSLPSTPYGVSTYYLVAPAEASANLARYDAMVYSKRHGENALGQAEVMAKSRGETLGKEVRRRILTGTYALSAGYYDAYYGKALKVRRLIANELSKAFKSYDFLLTPTAPSVAYSLGEKRADPVAMYLDDIDTVLANLAGIAAVSVPAGTAEADMPAGMQFLAPAMQDEKLMQFVNVLEQAKGEDFAPLAQS